VRGVWIYVIHMARQGTDEDKQIFKAKPWSHTRNYATQLGSRQVWGRSVPHAAHVRWQKPSSHLGSLF